MIPEQDNSIDRETYSMLKDLMGTEGFQEIIDFFISDTGQALKNLEQAIDQQKPDYVGGICHKLKSSSKLIGAFNMAELSTELEGYAESKDAARAKEVHTQLTQAFYHVKAWLQAEEEELVNH